MRDTIFIGHARPEDDEFTLWLYSKLKNEGYKVECDLTYLTGGEQDAWKSLQNILENETCKYLLVFSKSTFEKQGVIDEWEQMRSLARKENLIDFIYPLRIDDTRFDQRIGLNVMNHFSFDAGWPKALKKLLFKLDKDGIPRPGGKQFSINDWLMNKYSTQAGVNQSSELFYSNWLSFSHKDLFMHFYRYQNEAQAEAIKNEIVDYPVITLENHLITFLDEVPKNVSGKDFEIECKKHFKISVDKLFKGYKSTVFPKYDDAKNIFVRLTKEALNLYLGKRGLNFYEMSNGHKCYYFIKDQLEKNKVFFSYNGVNTYKQLVGDYFEGKWHYGLSYHPILFPSQAYSLRGHIIFSDDGVNIWSSKSKLHKARRCKGKSFFNAGWRNLMLAFIRSLSDNGENIIVPLAPNNTYILPIEPLKFESQFGYDEPKDKGRMVPVEYYEIDEEDQIIEYDELVENFEV